VQPVPALNAVRRLEFRWLQRKSLRKMVELDPHHIPAAELRVIEQSVRVDGSGAPSAKMTPMTSLLETVHRVIVSVPESHATPPTHRA
jgi:hypothetical protein